MTLEPVSLALVQTACVDNPAENLERACRKITEAAASGAQIVCLQELFTTRYFCQTEEYAPFTYAESIPGSSTDRLQRLAGALGVVIVASLFEKRDRGLFHNTAAVLDADGSYLGKYRKMHIPDDPGFYEKFYFTPGDLGYKVFDTRYARIGVLICWDQWYPEAARLTALKGAEILVYPTAIGWAASECSPEVRTAQQRAWKTMQLSHAVANACSLLPPIVSVSKAISNSGETVSSAIRSGRFLPRPDIRMPSFWRPATGAVSDFTERTGRFCVTGVSRLTGICRNDSLQGIDGGRHDRRVV